MHRAAGAGGLDLSSFGPWLPPRTPVPSSSTPAMIEKRALEIRNVSGRALEGVGLRYGDTAEIGPLMRETFQPGAFAPINDVILTSHHDRATPLARTGGGGLVIEDSPTELRIRAELPMTTQANDTLVLVRSKVLRGLSIEFVATEERLEGDLRIVDRAHLSAVSVVDSPAYAGSTVESRAKKRSPRTWITGGIRYGVVACCQCLPGGTGKVIFHPKALSPRPDVLAVSGRLSETIASSGGGTLAFTQTDQALRFKILNAARETAAGGVIADLIAARAKIYARPLVEPESSTFKDINGVREYEKAVFGGLLIKPINDSADDAREGWDPIKVDGEDGGPKRPRRRSVLSWL